MSEQSTLKLPKRGTLARVFSWLGRALTRFWWVLILVLALLFFWLKRKLQEARLAEGLRTQRDIERRANDQYKTLGYKNRAARAKLNAEILQSRKDWTDKRKEIEDAISRDRQNRTMLWDRAFGSAPVPVRSEGAGK